MSNSTSFVTEHTHKETEYTALVEETSCFDSSNNPYPGHRRGVPTQRSGPPSDHVLIRTAGNALQAIPRTEYEASKNNVLAVSVPSSAVPGDTVMVRNSGTNPPQFVQATIPPGSVPGKTIFVNIPPTQAAAPIAPVVGAEPLHDLELVSSSQPVASNSDFVRVQVPEGYTPGARLLVKTGDGDSEVVEAMVPSDPTIREFYLRVQDAKPAPAQAYVV